MAKLFSSAWVFSLSYIFSLISLSQAFALEIEIRSGQVNESIGVAAALSLLGQDGQKASSIDDRNEVLRATNAAVDEYIEGGSFLTTQVRLVFPERGFDVAYHTLVRLRLDTIPDYIDCALQFMANAERPKDSLLDQVLRAMEADLLAMRDELAAIRPSFDRGLVPGFNTVQEGHRFFHDFVRRYRSVRHFLLRFRGGLLNGEPVWLMPVEDLVDAWGFAQRVLDPGYQAFYQRVTDMEAQPGSLYVQAALTRARLESIAVHIVRLQDLLDNTAQGLALVDWLNALAARVEWLLGREGDVPFRVLTADQRSLFIQATQYALDEFTAAYTVITEGAWVLPNVDLRARENFHRMWEGLNAFWRDHYGNEAIPLEALPLGPQLENNANINLQHVFTALGLLFTQCLNPGGRHNGACGGCL